MATYYINNPGNFYLYRKYAEIQLYIRDFAGPSAASEMKTQEVSRLRTW